MIYSCSALCVTVSCIFCSQWRKTLLFQHAEYIIMYTFCVSVADVLHGLEFHSYHHVESYPCWVFYIYIYMCPFLNGLITLFKVWPVIFVFVNCFGRFSKYCYLPLHFACLLVYNLYVYFNICCIFIVGYQHQDYFCVIYTFYVQPFLTGSQLSYSQTWLELSRDFQSENYIVSNIDIL